MSDLYQNGNDENVQAFIDPTASVPVTLGKNTIYVREKMGLQVRGRVQKALASWKFQLGEDGNPDASEVEMITSPQEQMLIMLQHNITGWDGPAFEIKKNGKSTGKKVPVTHQTIANLNPDWKLVTMAYEMIQELNRAPIIEDEGDKAIRDPLPVTPSKESDT